MGTFGNFTEFSLLEIFQLIEKGKRGGLLTIRVLPFEQSLLPSVYYIWVREGRIVTIANRLDQQGLVNLIDKTYCISHSLIARLNQFCSLDKPLGLCLKNQGILNKSQLKELFYIQVLQPLFILCQLQNGQFEFEPNVPIPAREVLGLSVPAGAVIILKESVNYIQQLVEVPSSISSPIRRGENFPKISSRVL